MAGLVQQMDKIVVRSSHNLSLFVEHNFMAQENRLDASEFKTYVYSALNIQRCVKSLAHVGFRGLIASNSV